MSNIAADAAIIIMFCFVMKLQMKLCRIFSASLIGAVTNCVMAAVSVPVFEQHICNTVVTAIMLLIIIGKEKITAEYFIKSIVVFCFIGFMFGGLLYCFVGDDCSFVVLNIFLIAVIIVVYVISGEHGLSRFRQYNSNIYEVTLYRKNSIKYTGTGYYDSGNGVREPLSGALVIIGCLSELDGFLTEGEKQYIKLFPALPPGWDGETYIRGIPYNSLGHKKGMMPGIKIERLDIRKEHIQKTYKNIYVGVSPDKLSVDEKYDFILHREMY